MQQCNMQYTWNDPDASQLVLVVHSGHCSLPFLSSSFPPILTVQCIQQLDPSQPTIHFRFTVQR